MALSTMMFSWQSGELLILLHKSTGYVSILTASPVEAFDLPLSSIFFSYYPSLSDNSILSVFPSGYAEPPLPLVNCERLSRLPDTRSS